MAQYTLTMKQLIENNIPVFDFYYELDNEYKELFERLFIDFYYYDEIGFETVGRFKHRLKNKIDLLSGIYNKLFFSQSLEQRILDNYDVTESFNRIINSCSKSNNNSINRNLYKDAPKTKIDIDRIDIVNSITKDINENSGVNNNENNESWTRTMKGNIGIQTDADAIKKFESSIRNTMMEFITEFEELFMGVY